MSQEEPAGDAPEIVAEFPAPPAFLALYRDGPDAGPPPPEPMAPTYHMFGTPYSTQDAVPDLLPGDGRKLYAQGAGEDGSGVDYKAEMKKLNRSLLANFVELVDVLMKNPAMFNAKLDDLELLFLNLHNLINAFRPHQARETTIQMLKTQIEQRREAAREIRQTIDNSRRAVEQAHAEMLGAVEDAPALSSAASSPLAVAGDDGDIKMEDVESAGESASVSETSETAVLTAAQLEQAEKAKEAQRLQEQFFSALEAAMG